MLAFMQSPRGKGEPNTRRRQGEGIANVMLTTAVVNIKTLKGRFIAHKFSTGWTVGVVKSMEKKKSVASQFAVKYSNSAD